MENLTEKELLEINGGSESLWYWIIFNITDTRKSGKPYDYKHMEIDSIKW